VTFRRGNPGSPRNAPIYHATAHPPKTPLAVFAASWRLHVLQNFLFGPLPGA